MREGIAIEISVRAEQVLAQLDHLPERMGAGIAAAMDKENELTIAHIQRNRLTGYGPFPVAEHRLGNRPGEPGSGSLRQSVNATKSAVSGDDVTSAIGASVHYAVVHELGFEGDVQVREYKMRLGMKDQFRIGGVTMTRQDALRIYALQTKKQFRAGMADAGNQWRDRMQRNRLKRLAMDLRRQESDIMGYSFGQVRAHKRHMRMPARAPIRTGIEERADRYGRAISRAILAAWQELSGAGNGGGVS